MKVKKLEDIKLRLNLHLPLVIEEGITLIDLKLPEVSNITRKGYETEVVLSDFSVKIGVDGEVIEKISNKNFKGSTNFDSRFESSFKNFIFNSLIDEFTMDETLSDDEFYGAELALINVFLGKGNQNILID